jgi:hypothetical protein
MKTTFSDDDLKSFEPEMKVGLLATINPHGLPHITLISTLRGASPTQVVWGQFAEGQSKDNIQQNPRAGWLILTLEKNIWRGKATYTHTAVTGKEFEIFNNLNLFRYNAYFGIHRAWYMDLVEQTGKQPLPMGAVIQSAVKTIVARKLSPGRGGKNALNPWIHKLIGKLDNLKFLAYVGEDGYPVIIPVIQAQTAGNGQVIFSAGAFGAEIRRIPAGIPMAFFCMAFTMEDILLRGVYRGLQRRAGFLCGALDVDWVYSPMPPTPAQVYPPLPLEAVTDF